MTSDCSRARVCEPARRGSLGAAQALAMTFCFLASGCISCDVAGHLAVHGRVVDADTDEALPDLALGGRAYTEEQQTDDVGPLIFDGSPRFPLSAADGTFSVEFSTDLMPCQDPPPEFPRPDRVEIIVVRNGCEQTFSIEINEDTVVDMTFPDDVIELKDPILVPACEQ